MDKTLRKEIAREFSAEYLQAAKQKRTGFWKRIGDFDDKLNSGFFTVLATGFAPLASLLLIPIALPIGLAALALCLTTSGLTVYLASRTQRIAEKEIERDIDNGLLPDRYRDILDQQIKVALDFFTEKKSQLPAKGAASASFVSAVSEALSNPAVPVPMLVAAPTPHQP